MKTLIPRVRKKGIQCHTIMVNTDAYLRHLAKSTSAMTEKERSVCGRKYKILRCTAAGKALAHRFSANFPERKLGRKALWRSPRSSTRVQRSVGLHFGREK